MVTIGFSCIVLQKEEVKATSPAPVKKAKAYSRAQEEKNF